MRLPSIALLPAVLLSTFLLAGCTKGYTFDYLRAETSLVAPKLGRFGLDQTQSLCVAQRLAGNLEVWQMRRFGDAAGLAVRRGTAPLPLTARDLAWVASQSKDPKVPDEVSKALKSCGLLDEAKDAPSLVMETKAGDEIIAGTPFAGDLPPPSGAPPIRVNGPANYQPHADLLKALDAFEAGDRKEAARLAKIAAQQGDSGAQQFLAGLYSAGLGVPADPVVAATYYNLAAEQGWSEAMNNLGQAYEKGEGVPRDPVIALKWYLLASARPTEDAEKVANNLQNLVRDMTPEEIQKAASLAREWENNHRR